MCRSASSRNAAAALAMVVALLAAAPAISDSPAISADKARAARAAGLIKPLATLLSLAEARFEGDLIEVELRQNGARWTYEFEFLPRDGRAYEVVLDASTGEVIRTRGPVREKR